MTQDSSLRFLFDNADIRGECVLLSDAFNEVIAAHCYSDSIKQLLGEFAAAAVLISNNLKYQGKIVLQARASGPLELVMMECTSDLQIRGIARGNLIAEAAVPLALLADGQLAITIEREGGQNYQGIVALESDTLAGALQNYFLQSEQLHTRFWLTAQKGRAAGMMLQQLPAQLQQEPATRQDQWDTACILAETVTPNELVELAPVVMLHRLFHEMPIRIFDPINVIFGCSCSHERSLSALSLLTEAELVELLKEEGAIMLHCDMCGTDYRFVQSDIPMLAENGRVH
jgi:molecular chaperone Hsp33